ncbi:RHS repeat-associated core domain-containing protein [Streptomyces sp. DSM 44917]|uniref:RHS repeat-associated core domain-containing protein n=1 Tax=Streptomyces boetiae TaxID=3075541 RepID=A0ABU2L2A4_9ACTN|nr:DUF6531 domain-containing protein [Streptomyces sp. DSM 44917]MDT0305512.1 RHS repeat-associated core domain-containing protein [Streptomyces sp. DSM 44917]
MGLDDIVSDLTPDSVENVVESGVELVGEGVDAASGWTADRLEDAGLESAAGFVRAAGDAVANRMGADVDEWNLDQTTDPRKLIHGSAGKLRSTAAHLVRFRDAFTAVGDGLAGVDSAGLRGETADAFRRRIEGEPRRWYDAAAACDRAGRALGEFAGTVEWAQERAREAIERYRAASRASEEAREAHNAEVERYNRAVDAHNAAPAEQRGSLPLPPRPGAFHDPGVARAEEAAEILAEARRQRNAAADAARREVAAAREAAPATPSYGDQVTDAATEGVLHSAHVTAGVLRGGAGVLNSVRAANPLDPYNLTHPAEYLTNLNSTGAGFVQAARDPAGAVETALDSAGRDPAEAMGRAVPEVLGSRGRGALRPEAPGAPDAPDVPGDAPAPSAREQVREDGPRERATPDAEATTGGTDPVNLATGRMFLAQADVTLPGALPLAFTRRVESGYRLGRWFGPSWSSTVDQRLEIDAEGVVLLTEDGLVLAYPHPAPGAPSLPASGPARPLERTPEGDYRLTDPAAGLTWHFDGPAEAQGDGPREALLAEISDRNGHRITVEYDGTTPTGLVHSAGYRLRLTTEAGRVTALHLAGAAPDGSDQELVRFGYTAGNLTEVINSSGRPLRYTYDERGRVTSWTDTNGHRYAYAYDGLDRCVAQGGTEGHLAARIAYGDPDPSTGLRVTTVTTPEGHARHYAVDAAGRVVAETDPLGHTTRTAYDTRGRVTARTDALGRTTAFHRDARGDVVAVVRPDGSRFSFAYNDLRLPAEIAEPGGAVWRLAYDERGNRTAVTDPDGHTTRYAYDANGRPTAVTDALGATTRLRCDAAGLPVEITDPLGGVTAFRRDAFGRPVEITDPLGGTERLEWTVEGRPARHVAADGAERSWAWDGEGNCVRHTDPVGGVTAFAYGPFDLPLARTDPDGARHAFAHDSELRLRSVTNPRGLTWTYAYDAAGRLTSETDFDGRTLTFAHDATGALTARTNALGQTVAYERDALGRVARKEADGRATVHLYDAAGRLASALGPDAELHLRRDRLGRVLSETVAGRVLSHAYDPLGRPVSRTTPGGAVSAFRYDAAGRRTGLDASGHALAFAHDAAGRETARRVGSLLLTRDWDPAGRLASQALLASGAPEPLARRSYTYRADGHLAALEDPAGGARAFDLDAVGRVTAVRGPGGWAESYAYDGAGDQTHAAFPGAGAAAGARAYAGTRVTRAGRIRYAYDAAGRITSRRRRRLSGEWETWRYAWDAEDRLTAVTTPDGTRWRYRYDPLGRRVAKERLSPDGSSAVERTDFTWDGPVLVEQTTAAPAFPAPVTLTWDHDGLHPIAQTERRGDTDSRFFAIVTDLIGTPTHLVDPATGTVAWQSRTTLWGTTAWPTTSTAHTPLRFPGQYADPESGLHYNLHRHYDPTTARYTTPDPLGLTPAPNPVAYVHNPLTWSDPWGLAPCPTGDRAIDESLARIDPDNLTMTRTVERHLDDFSGRRQSADGGYYTFRTRPFVDSHQLVLDIMAGSAPMLDPRGVPGALRWDTPGAFNGRSGRWELVIDTQNNRIMHFNFTSER